MALFANPLPPQRGFTYIWLLLAIALTTVGLAAVAEVASTAIRRDKEAELLFVGNQYVRAIALYNASTPSGAQQYPQRLEDLLADKRYPSVRRYLRRVYADPMTGSTEWGLSVRRRGDVSRLGLRLRAARGCAARRARCARRAEAGWLVVGTDAPYS